MSMFKVFFVLVILMIWGITNKDVLVVGYGTDMTEKMFILKKLKKYEICSKKL
jgi:hypothetical protein